MDNNENRKKEMSYKKSRPLDHTSPDWKGYSLEELIYRKEVNHIKQQIIIERLNIAFNSMKERHLSRSSSGFMSGFNSLATIADYGITGFKIFTKMRALFRSLKK